jgi:hypothetical protein
VKLVGAGAAAAAMPWGCGDNLAPPPSGLFFDAAQWAAIDAATDVVLPGARAAMAVRYIDGLLGAFEVAPPAIFGGGPFSGRAPLPGPDGGPSPDLPPDAFAQFLPMSRVRVIAWRARLFGTAQTHGADFNDAVLGATIGWRDVYAGALAALEAAAAHITAGARFVDLGPDDQQLALGDADAAVPGFLSLFVEHTIEGTFAAPEYGGNASLAGWQMARYDGDSAPLGHAFYDLAAGAYRDRPDQPTSIASPGDGPEDFDPDVVKLITVAALGSGGMVF